MEKPFCLKVDVKLKFKSSFWTAFVKYFEELNILTRY